MIEENFETTHSFTKRFVFTNIVSLSLFSILAITWGIFIMVIPFVIFGISFGPLELINTKFVSLSSNEIGINYTDFSQHIFLPWNNLDSIKKNRFLNVVDVKADLPSANFSIPLKHPRAESLINLIKTNLEKKPNES